MAGSSQTRKSLFDGIQKSITKNDRGIVHNPENSIKPFVDESNLQSTFMFCVVYNAAKVILEYSFRKLKMPPQRFVYIFYINYLSEGHTSSIKMMPWYILTNQCNMGWLGE